MDVIGKYYFMMDGKTICKLGEHSSGNYKVMWYKLGAVHDSCMTTHSVSKQAVHGWIATGAWVEVSKLKRVLLHLE